MLRQDQVAMQRHFSEDGFEMQTALRVWQCHSDQVTFNLPWPGSTSVLLRPVGSRDLAFDILCSCTTQVLHTHSIGLSNADPIMIARERFAGGHSIVLSGC